MGTGDANSLSRSGTQVSFPLASLQKYNKSLSIVFQIYILSKYTTFNSRYLNFNTVSDHSLW